MADTYIAPRQQMVRDQLEARGIKDKNTLAAMGKVPRHLFVAQEDRQCAYGDYPLPIGSGQTISQPYIVALMTEALGLSGGENVLEIGTGGGYAAAVLAEIAKKVVTVERVADLADLARDNLRASGHQNVTVICGDGTLGWPEDAPYDGISVTAGGPSVPKALKDQLAVGGRLVMPVGRSSGSQDLIRLTRVSQEDFKEDNLGGVRFVPLIGAEGWTQAPVWF